MQRIEALGSLQLQRFSQQTARPLGFSDIASPLPDRINSSQELRPAKDAGTAAWIHYFDTNWKQEGLPSDWYNLKTQSKKRVGFILNQQMDILKNPYDKDALSDWITKTKRDLEGFKLEFLSDNVVYPRKYVRNPLDQTRLEDPLYGKAKDGSNYAKITELVSDQERNGAVKSSVENMQEFFATAPDGAIAIMTSPLGPSGFKTEDGLAIDYPDSYFFIMQKSGNTVMNYTVKTDLRLQHCRQVIAQLTGKNLPENASLETYVQTLAFINPGEHARIRTIDDVITIMENVQPEHAFIDKQNAKITKWEDVRDQIRRGEDLYNFGNETAEIIDEYVEYAQEGIHTKAELHKAISVTILRLGELFFGKELPAHSGPVTLTPNVWQFVDQKGLFGAILERTAERRGCSGGGSVFGGSIAINSLVPRTGVPESAEDQYGPLEFKCTKGHRNTRPRGQLISHCAICGENVACG
jgi:hypothetical protein